MYSLRCSRLGNVFLKSGSQHSLLNETETILVRLNDLTEFHGLFCKYKSVYCDIRHLVNVDRSFLLQEIW